MRITGGEKRGAVLYSLEGDNTRPTLDQVKEAVFSMIHTAIYNAHVLDLFAGSGAIGLEALSRGAERCIFVDQSPKAIQVIEKNIRKLKLEDRAFVKRCSAVDALDRLRQEGQTFDLVYMDPPFAVDCFEQVLSLLEQYALLKPGAMVVLEEDYAKRALLDLEHYEVFKDKRYGRISIRILRSLS